MSISPICISFKGQMSAEKSIVTNSIDKAAEVAEKNFKTPEDSFTKNSTDVHCAFWNNLSKNISKAANAVVNAVKEGVNNTIDSAGQKSEEKFKNPEDVYVTNNTNVNAQVVKGLIETVISSAKAAFKKEEN